MEHLKIWMPSRRFVDIATFALSADLFIQAASTRGEDCVSNEIIKEILHLIRTKNDQYYKEVSKIIFYIDQAHYMGMGWYQTTMSSDVYLVKLIKEVCKAYYFYLCGMPDKKSVPTYIFTGECGHTYIREDNIHLLTWYHTRYVSRRRNPDAQESYIPRMRTIQDAKNIDPLYLEDFLVFSAKKSYSDYYSYELTPDNQVRVYEYVPPLKGDIKSLFDGTMELLKK